MDSIAPTVVSNWLDVLWVVDHSWYTQEKKSSSNAVLDTNRCTWHLLPYPVQRHLHFLSCPLTLWMAYTIISWLKNNYLTCLLPFIYTDGSGFNKWHSEIRDHGVHLDSPGQSMSWKEQVFLMLCILGVLYTYLYLMPIWYQVWKPNATLYCIAAESVYVIFCCVENIK